MDDISRDPHADAPSAPADNDRLRRKGPVDEFAVEGHEESALDDAPRARLPRVMPLVPLAADADDDADLLAGHPGDAGDDDPALSNRVSALLAAAGGRVDLAEPADDTDADMADRLDDAQARDEAQLAHDLAADTAGEAAPALEADAESNAEPAAELDEPAPPSEVGAVVEVAPAAATLESEADLLAGAEPITDPKKLQRVVFGLLLTNREGLSPLRLAQVCDTTQEAVKQALLQVQADLAALGLPLELSLSGESFKLWTSPDVYPWLEKLRGIKKNERLSPAALETLAVIAYRQPVFRAEIEAIRGVKVGPMLRTLLDCKLVGVVGRADVPGRPLQYGTTQLFLERFGLSSLNDLPSVKEFKGLQG